MTPLEREIGAKYGLSMDHMYQMFEVKINNFLTS